MTNTRLSLLLGLATLALPTGCASSKNHDGLEGWGFEADGAGDVALVGPVREDRAAFERIRELEDSGALATLDGTREVRSALRPTSQSMLAAVAPALFRAGVYAGSPELIDVACDSLKRVTHAGLRRSNGLSQFDQACGALAGNASGPLTSQCHESIDKLVSAYANLKSGDERAARKSTAEALREHAACPNSRPLTRTPVPPDSRGFIVVVALQAMRTAPATYLGNESAPRTTDSVNAAFAQNARLIKTGVN